MQGILISIITVGVPDCCAADLRVYPSGTIWKGNKLEILIGILVSGKFEMHILPQVGHAVHEDSPNKVADVLSHFLVRNKFAQPKEAYSPTFPAC
jgi:hypothetical protein